MMLVGDIRRCQMVTLSVTLTEEQEAEIRRLAAERGVAAEELVRRLVETLLPAYWATDADKLRPQTTGLEPPITQAGHAPIIVKLGKPASADAGELRRRAREAAGSLKDGPPDLSINHDKYFAEACEDERVC
jgi:hypothetical protein